MERMDRRDILRAIAGTAGLAALSHAGAGAAEPGQPETGGGQRLELRIPESLKLEHDELHEELVRATKAGGRTGEAARAVARALHPHFVREEELALPPLGLLRALADGPMRPEMAQVIALTDRLKAEMPTMLEEHEAIVGALETLTEAAKAEDRPEALRFAEKLTQHARTEEDVTYPAAILVGEYVKLKLGRGA